MLCANIPVHILKRKPVHILKRNIHKLKKGRGKEKTDNERALEYYDSVYPKIFGDQWNVIKKSLLIEPKYVALINNFSENGVVVEAFKNMGAFDIGAFYNKKVNQFNEDENLMKLSSTAVNSVDELPSKIRPSEMELTDDEKAALAEKTNNNRYPEKFCQMALASGIVSGVVDESKPNASRKIDGATINGINISAMYDYVPSVKLKGLDDWIEEGDVFVDANDADHEIGVKKIRPSKALKWPEHLKAFSFIGGDLESEFSSPHECQVHGISPHFLMNGASLLPVLALDLQPQDKVFDICASPGGKSLAILQTCLPHTLICNDVSSGRTGRIITLLDEYVPAKLGMREIVEITKFNGCLSYYEDCFDKVLVDVPCLNDRHSVQEPTENIFKTSRVKERLRMPEVQAQLLFNAIKAVKPGGSVVYSTCTLSPLQNDGSVHLALTRIWRETRMECSVVDLGETLRHLGFLYKMGKKKSLRYGDIVIPDPNRNFGPMYFSKIIRNK